MKSIHILPLVLVVLSLAMFPGCGDGRPKRVPVSGKVTIDGKPLEAGYIRFIPADNRAAVSPIASDGSFKLTTFDNQDGVTIGRHTVAVIAMQNKNNGMVIRYLAPEKYTEAETSDVTVDIDGPTDSLAIDLTWEGSGKTGPYEVQSEVSGDLDPAAVVE